VCMDRRIRRNGEEKRETKIMKILRPVVVIVVAVAVVLVAQRFIRRTEPQQQRRSGDVTVVAQTVEFRNFSDRTEAIGTISANESIVVTPAATERIAGIHFDDGESVQQGDVLVELEHAEESAALEAARIDLAEQERQFRRVEVLRDQNLVSQEELDLAQGYLEAAKARVAAAEARLSDRIITAPFAGVLGIRRVSPGTLVSPGDVITTLDDLGVVKVDFTLPEALLNQIAIGRPIQGRSAAWPGEVFAGRVMSIDSRVDRTTRAVALQARVPNPERRLRAGMLMTVELTCRQREALGVPERALLSYADKQYVYVVGADSTVEQREVMLGRRDVGWVEVVSGLSPGETIVVDGLLNLRDGASVRVESSDGSPAPTAARSQQEE
jgi:membrane fusion protein (multidrug efflux system)